MTSSRTQSERAPWRAFVRAFARNSTAALGLAIVAFYVLLALSAPLIAPHSPTRMEAARALEGPSAAHWLGTDRHGRDILSRIIFGARPTLAIAAGAVMLALFVGAPIGVIAGYFGRWLDTILMRLMDVLLSFPALLLALVVIAILGQLTGSIIFAIGLVYVPQFARIARSAVLGIKELEYVEAGRALGSSTLKLLQRHIVPNIMSPLIVQASLNLSLAVLYESALSFLGMGTQPPTPSWGLMLSDGRRFMEIAPWIAIAPGVSIMLLVLGLNLLGDALRDLLDPRQAPVGGTPGGASR
jgi:peptide/nickel transport system permease protein